MRMELGRRGGVEEGLWVPTTELRRFQGAGEGRRRECVCIDAEVEGPSIFWPRRFR
jgi:hypothetical protein